MKNILITLFYADGLHGGVKYSAELGEYFHSLGYRVYLAGVKTNNTTQEFFKAHHVHLFNVKDFPTDIEFDIVWAHHFPILPYLIKHRGTGAQKTFKYKYLINSCISEILPIEKFMPFPKEIDMFLTLTGKLRSAFINDYNFPAARIHILPNTAPDMFFDYPCTPASDGPHKIAIVSNHPPRELVDAIELFESAGIDVTMYGGANPVDITPAVLGQYDAIITIGKTVQYSLAMGIPVYNYDHFGGSGYITPDNIDVEEAANFSGRSFRTKKSAEQIVTEVKEQYARTLARVAELKSIAQSRYRLSTRVGAILETLQKTAPRGPIEITNENRLFFDYCEFIIEALARHDVEYQKKRERPLHRIWRHIKTGKF